MWRHAIADRVWFVTPCPGVLWPGSAHGVKLRGANANRGCSGCTGELAMLPTCSLLALAAEVLGKRHRTCCIACRPAASGPELFT